MTITEAVKARVQDVVEVLWVNAPVPVAEKAEEAIEWRVRAERGLIRWINNLSFDANIRSKDLAGRLLDTAVPDEEAVQRWIKNLSDAKYQRTAGGIPWTTASAGNARKRLLASSSSRKKRPVRSRKPPKS